MSTSREINHSPLQIDLKYRRLFKYHNNRKPNMELSQTKTSSVASSNTGLHFTGKINFHELLSVPLQKQILMQNKIKKNQTFFLKFQTQSKKRSPKPTSKAIKGQKKDAKKTNKKLIIFSDKRNILNSQKSERKSEDDFEKQGELRLKEVSKTVYFKPLGKIIHSSSMSQHIQRNSLQFERSSEMRKRDIDNSVQVGNCSPRDKLLMLLQIRRNQRIQKQNNCCNIKPSFSRYGNLTQRQFSFKSRIENKSDEENVQKSTKWEKSSNSWFKYMSKRQNQRKIEDIKNDEPTPWQLADHIDDF